MGDRRGPVEFQIDSVPDSNNVAWAIDHAMGVLNSTKSSPLNKAIQLRFLIHFVGDVHQPLHIINGFSKQFPSPVGDMGGNLYIIHGVGINDLHGFYDSGALQWETDLTRPLSAGNASAVNTMATKLVQEYPM